PAVRRHSCTRALSQQHVQTSAAFPPKPNVALTAISRAGKTINELTNRVKCAAWKNGCRMFTGIMGFLPTLLSCGSPATVEERSGAGIASGIGNGIVIAGGTGIGERSGNVIVIATAIIGDRTSVYQAKIRPASTAIFSAG